MQKAIVFGIGNNWSLYQKSIECRYNVVALVDNNWKDKIGVHPVKVIDEIQFDFVIIMPDVWDDMYNQLLEMDVPEDKIVIYKNEPYYHEEYVFGWRSYGQHYEDLLLATIFAQMGIRKPTYIDLGTNNPYQGNNTAFLYESGCRGINIEANPLIMKKIEKARPEDLNLNIGISDTEGKMTFYMFSDDSQINTFSERVANNWMRDNPELKVQKVIELPVTTLENVVKKYCPDGFPDFLDCDIEGLDYIVLDSCSFKEDGPKVICVECHHGSVERFDTMLEGKGYFRFCRIAGNNIYVRNEYKKVLWQID